MFGAAIERFSTHTGAAEGLMRVVTGSHYELMTERIEVEQDSDWSNIVFIVCALFVRHVLSSLVIVGVVTCAYLGGTMGSSRGHDDNNNNNNNNNGNGRDGSRWWSNGNSEAAGAAVVAVNDTHGEWGGTSSSLWASAGYENLTWREATTRLLGGLADPHTLIHRPFNGELAFIEVVKSRQVE